MDSFKTMKKNIEGGKLGEGTERLSQKQLDTARAYNQVFSSPNGKIVLEDLDKHSHAYFPNYMNDNFTYSKIGEQNLVLYIQRMINVSKKE